MKLTYDEAKHSTQAYFPDDTVAPDVFLGKYALRDSENTILESDPDDMFKNRIAPELARIEAKYPNPLSSEQIYAYMCKRPGRLGMGPIVPQGSPLSGIGNPFKIQSISNCFVVAPPEDSYAGIFYTDQQEAQIMKRRGGVGFDISSIRPKGMPTANAAGTTDGIAVFMDRYSNTCREVAQGGRRGALMLSIQCFEGSTNVLTQDGWQRIDNVVDTQYSGKVWTHFFMIWLAISIGAHAFPSDHDAKAVLQRSRHHIKNEGSALHYLSYPFFILIWLANKLSFIWFDFFYAIILLQFVGAF
jgi:hypothetical protein